MFAASHFTTLSIQESDGVFYFRIKVTRGGVNRIMYKNKDLSRVIHEAEKHWRQEMMMIEALAKKYAAESNLPCPDNKAFLATPLIWDYP